MDSTIPRKSRGHFYDNMKCWEISFRSYFLPLLMLIFYFLDCLIDSLWGYNDKE